MKKDLTVEEVQYVAHRLAKEMLEWDEPIPAFSTRAEHKLESCLAQPFITVGGKSAYPTMKGKAAILFYLMNKNHPFQNGNKRVAITTLLYFLSEHGKWLAIDNQELYNFAKFVAASPPQAKDGMVGIIEDFISRNIVKLSI